MTVSVESISKSFADKRNAKISKLVLMDVSFDVQDGEFVCLVGPSGCGKTTLLTILAGFQKHNGGQVMINGKKVAKPGPDRAFVFQNYALLPWLKVGENIMYPMKKQKIPRAERKDRLEALLKMAKMEDCANHYINELSGGMKQRVALLRALACDPAVLLMDEPLGAVDFQMRKLLQLQLEAILSQKNVTTIMVTHDVDEAIYFSDRVMVMSRDHGRIISDIRIDLSRPRDRSDPLYHQYLDELTEDLRVALSGDVYNKEDAELMRFIETSETAKTHENMLREIRGCNEAPRREAAQIL
jgi:NitT/TauT family transport system ATP-binding protein